MKAQNMNWIPEIGEVYLMRFCGDGSEQNGWRPGVVYQNNKGNIHSPNIIALPLTTDMKSTWQPTHVFLPAKKTGLLKDSLCLCESPERMGKQKIGRYLTRLPPKYLSRIAKANLLATSAISYLDPKELPEIWEQASMLNNAIKAREKAGDHV